MFLRNFGSHILLREMRPLDLRFSFFVFTGFTNLLKTVL